MVYSTRSATSIVWVRERARERTKFFLQFRLFGHRVNVPFLFLFLWLNVSCRVLLLLLSALFNNIFATTHQHIAQALHTFPFSFEHLSYSFIHSLNLVLQQNLLYCTYVCHKWKTMKKKKKKINGFVTLYKVLKDLKAEAETETETRDELLYFYTFLRVLHEPNRKIEDILTHIFFSLRW